MCDALAATGTLRAVLRALRGHVSHEGIVAASCKVLLAYHEEFEGSSTVPSALAEALCAHGTPTALEEAQRRFLHSTEIQLGAEWAVGVARSTRAAMAADAGKPHAGRTPRKGAKRAEPTLHTSQSPRRTVLQQIEPTGGASVAGGAPRGAAPAGRGVVEEQENPDDHVGPVPEDVQERV